MNTPSRIAISRRTVLGAGSALLAMPAIRGARAAGAFDWKRFKGQHIEVAFPLSNMGDLLSSHHDEFRDLTGISLGFQEMPEQQFRQKLMIQFTSGSSDIDVVDIALTSQKRMIGKGKFMEDLRPLLADTSMTSPEFDFADFTPAAVAYATQPDGRMDTLPIVFYYQLLMWNKALFAAKGVALPTTLQGVLDAAKALHDPKNGVSGIAVRGLKNANTPVWTGFLLGYGKDAIDIDGAFNTTTPEAVEAATLYQTLGRDYGPEGMVGFNWYECQAEFIQGRAAMFIDTDTVGGVASNPKKSRIVDKVGYAVYPVGPKAHVAPMYADGIGISAGSSNKGPAWFYCQWALSKANQARLLAGGGGSACRASAYITVAAMPAKDRQVTDEWIQAVTASSKIAKPCIPQIVSANEFRTVFGVALANMLTGSDPAKQLAAATEQFKSVYAKYG